MEKNERDPESRPPEKTPRQTGNNFVWYRPGHRRGDAVAGRRLADEVPRRRSTYGDLVRLIEQGAPERNPDAVHRGDRQAGEVGRRTAADPLLPI